MSPALRRLQIITAAVAVSPFLATAVLALAGVRGTGAASLVPLAVLAGLIAPAVAHRVYRRMEEKIPSGADTPSRARALHTATLVPVAITEGAAFLGVFAFALSSEPVALLALATHLLTVGAIWPSERRFERFMGPAAPGELP